MSKQAEDRRQRRRASRKAQILDGAAQVFAQKGFHAATTKEIAEAADLSEGTIYNYFGSKEELLIEIMARLGETQLKRMQIASDQLDQALEQDAGKFLEGLFQTRQDFVAQSTEMLRAVVAEMLINHDFAERYHEQLLAPGAKPLEEHLAARIARGEVRDIDVSLLLRLISAVNLGVLGLLLIGDEVVCSKWDSEEMVDELTDFVMYGISAERKPDE